MAPFSFMTTGVNLLAKSFTAFSCTGSLARVLPAVYISPVKCLSSQNSSSPPKRPLNGYMRYYIKEQPAVLRHNPEMAAVDIAKKIASQWRNLSPEEKRPYHEAFLQAQEQFKVDFGRYKAQLTPEELQQQQLEKKQRLNRKKAIRKKKDWISMGKPKLTRSPFAFFLTEHFETAKGTTIQDKMKSLTETWKKMLDHQKQVYKQLSEDDAVRYKNEIKQWEMQMIEIGRNDLVRRQAHLVKKPATVKAKTNTAKTDNKVQKL